jgi:hypothetical protein
MMRTGERTELEREINRLKKKLAERGEGKVWRGRVQGVQWSGYGIRWRARVWSCVCACDPLFAYDGGFAPFRRFTSMTRKREARCQ